MTRQSARSTSEPYTSVSTPDFDVMVSGRSLQTLLAGYLQSITVDDDVSAPGMCTVEFQLGDNALLSEFDNQTRFKLGQAIEVRLGATGTPGSAFHGDIVSVEPSFAKDRPPSLTIQSYDVRHRLQRGRRTRTFRNQTDHEIAEEIARGVGLTLSSDTAPPAMRHRCMQQANQTDMEFLQERAGELHYELRAGKDTLYFRPVASAAAPALKLDMALSDLMEFSARCSLANQVSQVEVRGWSAKDGKALVGRASARTETSSMPGTAAADLVERDFGVAIEQVCSRPLDNQDQVDLLARARFRDAALRLVTAEGLINPGRHGLRAGTVIRIDNVGRRFSGPYYLTSVGHRYVAGAGYTTRFTAQRDAL